jgi:hypothetical protein
MTNVVDFPKRELDIRVTLENDEERLDSLEDRVNALAEIMDLNIQGLYHVVDADAEEVMMTLLQLSAIWAVRAGLPPEEYEALVRSTRLEVIHDAP